MDVNDVEFWNKIKKEYVAGRKDQFDLDFAIFKRAVMESKTREELVAAMESKFSLLISRLADDRAKDLMEGLGPL